MSTVAGRPWSTAASRRRAAGLSAFGLLAVALHAVLLGGLEWPGIGTVPSAVDRSAMTVRVVTAAPALPVADDRLGVAVPPEPAAPTAKPVALARARARPAPTTASVHPARALAEPASASEATPAVTSVADEVTNKATSKNANEVAKPDEPLLAEAAVPLAEPPRPPVPPERDASDRELPVYRTLVPPATTVRYAMRRGALRGTGELEWAPDGDRYLARLVGRIAGITVLTQVSQGGFDEAGVAPLRFTDQRAAGAVRAANFQREVGKITYSGPSVEHTLLIGSQDRLSWMIQLAAVVAAEPQRLQEGGKVVIHVVGARGDSRVWVFRRAGAETITIGTDEVRTVRFVRDAAEAYDTRVEVWLDPRRHYLPARALLRSGPDDEGLELVAQEPAAVP